MRHFLSIFLLAALSVTATAKDKKVITLQVVETHYGDRTTNLTTPGTNTQSSTNCNSNATATDTGYGARASGTTNCTTTTTPGTPPQVTTLHIQQVYVYTILENGDHLVLWCQQGFRTCGGIKPGSYSAEVNGNSATVIAHEVLSGKERKIKFKPAGTW